LVLATLHTNNAAQSIDRIVDVFPPHQQQQIRTQLAGILQGIFSQRLVPQIGGGRIALGEFLMVTPAVRNLIREGKTHQIPAVIQTGGAEGMITMDQALANVVKAGKITLDEAKIHAIEVKDLERLVHG